MVSEVGHNVGATMGKLIIDTRHFHTVDWSPDGELYLDFYSINRYNHKIKLGENKFIDFKSQGPLSFVVRLNENFILTHSVNYSWDDITIIDLSIENKHMVAAEYACITSGPPYTDREIFSAELANDHIKIVFCDRVFKEDGRLDSEIMQDIRKNFKNNEEYCRLWNKYYPNEQDGSNLSDFQKDSENWTLVENEEVILNLHSAEPIRFKCSAENCAP